MICHIAPQLSIDLDDLRIYFNIKWQVRKPRPLFPGRIVAVASYYRGSETRARIGTAVAVLLLASIYADFAIPLEFELDKRGRKTDQPIPLDLTSTRFLGKMFLVVPLLAALAAHLAEPGLLTTDKAKKNQ